MSASVGIADTGPEQPKEFAFTPENLEKAKAVIAKYPDVRQQSAVMPLLDLAQRQCGGWLPRVAMDVVADMLSMPRIKAYEVATFYSMYNLKPVGKHFVQVCTTTPCWLVGSEGVVDACKKHLGIGLARRRRTANSRWSRSNAWAPASTRRWRKSTTIITKT